VRLTSAIDDFCADMFADGRFTSPATERSYRWTLGKHAEDVGNRDPRNTGREDVKRTLNRWQHPNTRSVHRAHLVSFYRYLVEEGLRKDNPAEQTRRPRKKPPRIQRLTRSEVVALRDAVRTTRERRIVDLGLFAGLRASELRGLQGRHFRRPGWVWVSEDIAKGSKQRWQPVPDELRWTWWEVARGVADDEFVIPKVAEQQVRGERERRMDPSRPISYKSLHDLVGKLGRRAGISHPVHPHLMRHAYGTGVADHTRDTRVAQALMGHSDPKSTAQYLGELSLDRLQEAVAGFGYGPATPSRGLVLAQSGAGGGVAEESAGSALSGLLAYFWCQPWLGRLAREMTHA
jgi:site-specific recombinase XerD